MNPYLELGVAETAGDDEIRLAYLRAIQKHSPETAPTRFQQMNAAFELIKNQDRRHEWRLFRNTSAGVSPLDVLVRHARLQGTVKPMPAATFKNFLRACAK